MPTAPQNHAPPAQAPTRYDNPTIVMHWLSAFLIVFQFVLGETWHWPPRPLHHPMVVAHLSAGVILTVLIPTRLWWRLTRGRHFASQLAPLDRFFTIAMESTLYADLYRTGSGLRLALGCGANYQLFRAVNSSPFRTTPARYGGAVQNPAFMDSMAHYRVGLRPCTGGPDTPACSQRWCSGPYVTKPRTHGTLKGAAPTRHQSRGGKASVTSTPRACPGTGEHIDISA